MRKIGLTLFAILLLGLAAPTASAASIELFEYAFNLDGYIWNSSSGLPIPYLVDLTGFDPFTSLGTIWIAITDPGDHYVAAFFDYEIDQSENTWFNEFGSQSGSSPNIVLTQWDPDSPAPNSIVFSSTIAGASGMQSWELDEPGFVFGDIYDNFEKGTLDNSNIAWPEDVSMALGWNFTLEENGQPVIISFTLTQPGGETVIPEPGTIVLLLSGLGLVAATRFRKSV